MIVSHLMTPLKFAIGVLNCVCPADIWITLAVRLARPEVVIVIAFPLTVKGVSGLWPPMLSIAARSRSTSASRLASHIRNSR